MKKVKISNKQIGDKNPCFIIAEAGSNHNGKLTQAKKLVDVAGKAGADAIKFQSFSAEKLFNKKYASDAVTKLRKFELSKEQHKRIFDYAKSKNLIFLSTPFDEESADMLEDIGVEAFKIASYELTHLPLLRHVARKRKPLILSTGMANLEEIRESVNVIYSTGNKRLVLTHCVSQYPTNPEDVNLKKIISMRNIFKVPVGFSDHTKSIVPAIAAVAMGASVIEKHFTLSRKLKGPDHFYALEPKELAGMIESIRFVKKITGDGLIRPAKSEVPERAWRRGIYAKTHIPKGAKIKKEMLSILRPAKGAKPREIEYLVGKTAIKNIKKGNHINRGHV